MISIGVMSPLKVPVLLYLPLIALTWMGWRIYHLLAKDFIRQLLNPNPLRRLTSSEALAHPVRLVVDIQPAFASSIDKEISITVVDNA